MRAGGSEARQPGQHGEGGARLHDGRATAAVPQLVVGRAARKGDLPARKLVAHEAPDADDVALQVADGARFRWRGGSAIEDSTLGSLARVYDVTVLSRPGNRGARMSALEAALFDSGHPVLMAPPTTPKTLGESITIHWNASTETARVMLLALPILRKAKRVVLLSVEGHIVPGPSSKDAVGYLEANGVAATEKSVVPRSGRPGEAILAEAKAQGADLLIKGAYTQSRLRQMIFGGATSHILGAAELPVFFAH